MRKNRSDNNHLIVIEQQLVDVNRNLHREAPFRQAADFFRRDNSHAFQRRRLVPCMIKEPHGSILIAPLRFGNFQPRANGRLTHRLMRSQRDQHVKLPAYFPYLPVQRLKNQTDGGGSRPVRNNEEYPLVPIFIFRTNLLHQLRDHFPRHRRAFRSGPKKHFIHKRNVIDSGAMSPSTRG